jgi:hypothetical protein
MIIMAGIGILAVGVLIFVFSYFVTLLLVLLGFFAICWALGYPITVKVDGKKVGYLRWTKFHSTL